MLLPRISVTYRRRRTAKFPKLRVSCESRARRLSGYCAERPRRRRSVARPRVVVSTRSSAPLCRRGRHLAAPLAEHAPDALAVDLSAGSVLYALVGDEAAEALARVSDLRLPDGGHGFVQGRVAEVPARLHAWLGC